MTRDSPGDSVVYSEEQRFRQIWILSLVGFIAILAWYSFLLQIVIGEPFGTNPAPDILVLALVVIFGIISPVWFLVMRLEVEVTRTDLRFRLFPPHLRWRAFPLATIVEAEAVTYRPFREYGGWGIRIGRRGMACNISGNRGVCRSRWKAGGRSCSGRSSQRNWADPSLKNYRRLGCEDPRINIRSFTDVPDSLTG